MNRCNKVISSVAMALAVSPVFADDPPTADAGKNDRPVKDCVTRQVDIDAGLSRDQIRVACLKERNKGKKKDDKIDLGDMPKGEVSPPDTGIP